MHSCWVMSPPHILYHMCCVNYMVMTDEELNVEHSELPKLTIGTVKVVHGPFMLVVLHGMVIVISCCFYCNTVWFSLYHLCIVQVIVIVV